MRPVFHRKPERVLNHVRICFLSYWISARLAKVPPHLNALLAKLKLLHLFAAPPKWASFPDKAQV